MARSRNRETDAAEGRGRRRRARPERRTSRRRRPFSWRLLRWGAVLAIWGFVAGGAVLAYFAYTLPEVGVLDRFARPPRVTMVAADGTVFATFGDQRGRAVHLDELPPYVPRAVLAIEDRRFYRHFGVDPIGIARAVAVNLWAGRIVQGGSTITQQLARNLFLTHARTFERKLKELLLAIWLEHKFTKDQILTIYLNRVYLGSGTYGIDAAARRYFAKPATELSLYEAALLAGLLKAPSRYNPARSPDLARARAQRVLASMVDAGFVAEDVAANARAIAPRPSAPGPGLGGRYFADWALDQVRGYVGYVDRDLKVHTTLDPALQSAAEARLAAGLDGAGRAAGAGQGAVVVLGLDGAVRALVGGRDYGTSQFNRATQALRQPGSAFKPFVYLAGFEAGLDPDDVFLDAPVRVGDWAPRNYGGEYRGRVTLREGLAGSLNSVAVRLGQRVGAEAIARLAKRLGITSDLRAEPSLALGASEVTLVELAAAYGAFATGGYGIWAHAIREIQDSAGRVMYRRAGSGPGILVAPEDVARMHDVLGAVMADGTGRAAALDRPAAGKTGTSQDFRDAWFVGYTADFIAGVWIGNDDGGPMNEVTGGGLPARVWRDVMRAAHRDLPPAPLAGAGPRGGPGRALAVER